MTTNVASEKRDSDVQKKPHKHPNLKHWKRILRSRTLAVVAIGCIALILLCYAISFFVSPKQDPNVVEISGRIECDETHMIAATGTRVTRVLVDEGEAVRKNQLLLTLDSDNIEKKIGSAKQIVVKAKSAKVQADRQVSVVEGNISEARKKSNGFWTKVFTTKKGREKQADQLRLNMMQAKMMQFQAQSVASQAQSAIHEAAHKISFFKLTSPIDGIVAVKSAEVGEIVGKGSVLMTLVDPKSAYMRGFIAEGDLAKVNIGQKADVYLGGDDAKPLKGKVVAIDAKPSFTPQNIYFKNDRLRQSFGMKIQIDNRNDEAKPGVRADAKIFIKSENGK